MYYTRIIVRITAVGVEALPHMVHHLRTGPHEKSGSRLTSHRHPHIPDQHNNIIIGFYSFRAQID